MTLQNALPPAGRPAEARVGWDRPIRAAEPDIAEPDRLRAGREWRRDGSEDFRTRLDRAERIRSDEARDEPRPVRERQEGPARRAEQGREGAADPAASRQTASETDSPASKAAVGGQADGSSDEGASAPAANPQQGETAPAGTQNDSAAHTVAVAGKAGAQASLAGLSLPAVAEAAGSAADSVDTAGGTAPAAPAAVAAPADAVAQVTAGTSGPAVPAWMLAAGARTAGQAGEAANGPAAEAPAESTGGKQTGPSAQGQGQVLPLFIYKQAADGGAADGEAGSAASQGGSANAGAGGGGSATAFRLPDGSAPESTPDAPSNGTPPTGDLQGQSPASAEPAAAARSDSVTKQVVSGAGDGAKAAAGTVAAEAAGGQAEAASASVRGAGAGRPPADLAGRPLGDAAEQVAESIRATGGRAGRQVTVHLNPPELGRVRIVLESEGDSVRGTVRVDVPETLSKLQQEAAPLMQRLQAEGIDLRRLDVALNQEQAGGQAGRDAAFGQGQNDPDAWTPGTAGQARVSADGDAVAAAAEAEGPDGAGVASGRSDGSINVQV
jgi:flagellar hook-length control protein FliK